MAAYAEEHGFGKATVTFRLKDWGVSRQRYWGTPIPMLYCAKDGIVPVPEISFRCCCRSTSKLRSRAVRRWRGMPEFVNATCPKCGGPARRETDTMDTFVDSSWYFYRYTGRAQRPRSICIPADCGVLVSDRPVHRRRGARHSAPDLLALLDEGDARSGPGSATTSRSSGCSPRGW